MDVFFQSLALFVPILAANQAAHLVRLAQLPDLPTSTVLFGRNKTILPFFVAPLLSMFVLLLYVDPHWFDEGLVLGVSVPVAEHMKSFVKRRIGLKEGSPWFLDRLDFAIGGALAARWYFPWVTWEHVICIIATAYPVHLIGNAVGYRLGWRKTPH